MPTFKYLAIDENGKLKNGVVEGDNEREALRTLGRRKLHTTQLTPFRSTKKSSQRKRLLPHVQQIIFLRQLGSLLRAAIPVDEALAAIIQNNTGKVIKIARELRENVSEGQSIARALENCSHSFPDYLIETIAAGEQSANLGNILEKIVDEIERGYQFRERISSALIYPVIVMLVSLAIVSALLVVVVPEIISLYENSDQNLPTATIWVINLSNFLGNHFGALIGILFVMIFGLRLLIKNSKIRYLWHRALGRLPIVGRILINLNAIRVGRVLGLLQTSGAPILQTLEQASQVVAYEPMRRGIMAASERVRAGSSLHAALKYYDALPQFYLYMIASGERNGRLGEMLSQATDDQEFELSRYSNKISNFFEPMAIVLTGGIVLFVVVAILLPIFEINAFAL